MVVWTGLLFLDHTEERQVGPQEVVNKTVSVCTWTPTITYHKPDGDSQPCRKCGQLTVFKIKAMEVEAFDQIPQRLGLERRHSRVTHFTDRTQRLSK